MRIFLLPIFGLVSTFYLFACAWENSNVEKHETLSIRTDTNTVIETQKVLPGAYQLEKYLPLICNSSLAVVANQGSEVDRSHLIDLLLKNNVKVKKVFSPEHGFRGEGDAGATINDYIDSTTNLPVLSLYGKTKKPKTKDLEGIDCILFDLQDVGVRFYTYISTLHYVMEAAAENKIPIIVLDRPNPNAHIVDGPVRKPQFKSFVGMHPVPILYGMTIGEYAQMINGEKWLNAGVQCSLTVIPIQNYTHDTPYSLPVAPSPNLKNDNSVRLYPSLCLLEGTMFSVGRGTEAPFELFGHPDFPKKTFSFTPKERLGASNPKLKNKVCYGVDLRDNKDIITNKLQLDFLFTARDALFAKYGEKWIDRPQFFNLLAGNNQLIKQLATFASETQIRQSWEKDLEQFFKVRKRYLLYD